MKELKEHIEWMKQTEVKMDEIIDKTRRMIGKKKWVKFEERLEKALKEGDNNITPNKEKSA